MEYYARVCFPSAVFTSRCVGKFLHLARPSVSQDIKFSNPSRSKYNQQETHAVIIFYIYAIHDLNQFVLILITAEVPHHHYQCSLSFSNLRFVMQAFKYS